MHYRLLLSAIAQAHTSAVGRAAAAVNQSLVLRNGLVGAYVVEAKTARCMTSRTTGSP